MRTAIVTVAIGDECWRTARLTQPTVRAFASRIGAEYICLEKRQVAKTHPAWERFRMYDLLDTYERILYLDSDALVRSDCPNLFELVPDTAFGAFEESSVVPRGPAFQLAQQQYGICIPHWNGKYYNTGVMVLSRLHKPMLVHPEVEINNYYEQSYVNLLLHLHGFPTYDLDRRFNMLYDRFYGQPYWYDAYILHYAGTGYRLDCRLRAMHQDLRVWRQRGLYLENRDGAVSGVGTALAARETVFKFPVTLRPLRVSTRSVDRCGRRVSP